jgi:hypothetical protein
MVVQHAIVPRLPVKRVLERWPMIKTRLMENGRKRESQLIFLGVAE